MRKCKICNLEKELNENNFSIRQDKGKSNFRWQCKPCRVNLSTIYMKNNKAARYLYEKEYYKLNKKKDNERSKFYRENHVEELRQYFRARAKQKRKIDPSFKLRNDVSTLIRRALKKNNSSKSKKSCFKYLEYDAFQLQQHLEQNFEYWMNWKNSGRYDPSTWDDNDSSTWIWQIDHIIPQSNLPYTSMVDNNFKRCWSLENLRPLSAKQNFQDGILRKRHNHE